MREARNATRITAKQEGMVRISGKPDIPCTLRNLSNTGALLNFAHPVILPRSFDLKFDGQESRATVVWQSGRLAGVKFQTPLRGVSAPKKRAWPWSRKSS